MTPAVFSFVCKRCGKVIASLSKAQAEYNLQAHAISCKKKKMSAQEQGKK